MTCPGPAGGLLRLTIWCLFLLLPLAHAGEVVFAYYNLKNYLVMNRRSPDGVSAELPKPKDEVEAVVSMIELINPDILGVAEIGDEQVLADFQERLSKAGMEFRHAELVRGFDGVRHLALLSKHPISARNSQSDVPLELNGKLHRMGRGILDATVDIGGVPVRFVGLHLKSKRKVPEYDEAKFRAKEAIAVSEHLQKILSSSPHQQLLLFGDFNDTKNEFPVKHIAGPKGGSTSLRVLPLLDARGESWTHFWAFADIYSRIDFLMVSESLWPAVSLDRSGVGMGSDWETASDHRPIFTTFSVGK